MARMRIVKPSFFLNESLADMPPQTRLYFIGLWCLCDRDGKMEYRPKPIKAQLFPYEPADIDAMTRCLHSAGMVQVYEVDGERYLKVTNFSKHQNPHIKEVSKGYPDCKENTVQAPSLHHTSPVGTGDLIMDNGNREQVTPLTPRGGVERFTEFWEAWPKSDRKTDKAQCQDKWRRYGLDSQADEVLAALQAWKACADWKKNGGNYIPAPKVWLNGRRWETPPALKAEVTYNPEDLPF